MLLLNRAHFGVIIFCTVVSGSVATSTPRSPTKKQGRSPRWYGTVARVDRALKYLVVRDSAGFEHGFYTHEVVVTFRNRKARPEDAHVGDLVTVCGSTVAY